MLAEDMAAMTHDPLAHALYSYPWGQGTLADVTGPRRWQRDTLNVIKGHLQDRETRHSPLRIAVASGHGIGKSALVGMIACWALDTCENTRVVITANTEQQIRTKTWPEVLKWRKMAITSHWWRPTKTGIFSTIGSYSESWRADAVTWSENNTEAFAGLHNKGSRIVIITDESSKIADKVWEVIEGALTDEDTEIIWIAFGNPTQATGRFRECFGRQRHLWHTRHIDARDVEGVNKAYLDEMVETYGEDSDIVRVRVKGQFPSSSSLQFIGTHLVEAARVRQVTPDPYAPVVMGVDVARFGDDSSTIYFRRGFDARSIAPVRMAKTDTMQLTSMVAELYRIHNAQLVCVDEGGVGAGVVDRLRQMNVPVFGVQFGARPMGAVKLGNGLKTANRRAEIWAIMREWLEVGAIPDDDILQDDLIGVEYGFNVRDEIQLEKKEHMKARGLASPDDGDGLALTFAAPVQNVPEWDRSFDETALPDAHGGY